MENTPMDLLEINLAARDLAEMYWSESDEDASAEARNALECLIGAGNAADLLMLVCHQRDHAALGQCLTPVTCYHDIPCAYCGMTRTSLMFREYENGTEWSGNFCC